MGWRPDLHSKNIWKTEKHPSLSACHSLQPKHKSLKDAKGTCRVKQGLVKGKLAVDKSNWFFLSNRQEALGCTHFPLALIGSGIPIHTKKQPNKYSPGTWNFYPLNKDVTPFWFFLGCKPTNQHQRPFLPVLSAILSQWSKVQPSA